MLSAGEYARMRASYRRVVVLDEVAPDEANELLEALARAAPTPAAEALDDLMLADSDPGDVSGQA